MRRLLLFIVFIYATATLQAQNTKVPGTVSDSTNNANSGVAEVSVSALDFDDENKGQNVSGLLHSGTDVFINTASYTLSAAYFRMRGYDSDDASVYMNGITVNDPENGRPSWSEWGGLNDAMRNKESVNGLSPARFGFGFIGGATNIITRASLQRKQNKLSYSMSDKSYTNRIMYTYSTGLMKNNWAFTFSGSRRWGNEGFVEGTFYDSYSYFGAAEKKINNKHSIGLTIYGSPTKRGAQAAGTQEAYDILGTNYYNPNWGYQNGEKRNAKVKNFHEPMTILNHNWNINSKTKLSNSLGYSFGKNATSNLNWYNAPDPRPDYYRNLPSYQSAYPDVAADPILVANITDSWKNDVNVRQINWDKLYQINALGSLAGKTANYIAEDKRNDHSQISFSSLLNFQPTEKTIITGGLELNKYTGYHFKVVTDLLGGSGWMDIDQFAERDFKGDTTKLQNNLLNPNHIVKVGDKFGYDYNTYVNSGLLWAQAEFSFNKLELFAAGNISATQFWRKGNMANGRDSIGSYGNSEKNNFLNYAVKAGATYKISGHHYLVGNIGYLTRAPFVRDAYLFPSITSVMVPNLTSEKIASGDISYIMKTQSLNIRLTAYQTMYYDGVKIINYYADDLSTFVNLSMTGIDKVHQGVELGAEIKATSTVSVIAVGSLGNFRYTSRPTGIVTIENDFVLGTPHTIYQKNFYVSGTPQNAASLGIKYAHPKLWFFNANLNYFDKMYLDFNPERRTSEALSGLYPDDPNIITYTKQEKLDGGFTLDASLGKSIYYKKYFINLNFSVNNILDNQKLVTNGYENMRFVLEAPNKFHSKYFYGLGRTFFLNLQVRI
ncbi:MAG: TonB-dependent receptor plug domain-containing protein [Bacteroidetes bacterium]|nr:TonB-dependent receptor plug domain-containing protein [Bacteroidota bacterium]